MSSLKSLKPIPTYFCSIIFQLIFNIHLLCLYYSSFNVWSSFIFTKKKLRVIWSSLCDEFTGKQSGFWLGFLGSINLFVLGFVHGNELCHIQIWKRQSLYSTWCPFSCTVNVSNTGNVLPHRSLTLAEERKNS